MQTAEAQSDLPRITQLDPKCGRADYKPGAPSLPTDLPCPLLTFASATTSHRSGWTDRPWVWRPSSTRAHVRFRQRSPHKFTSRAPQRHRPLFPREAEAVVWPRAVCMSAAVTPWVETAGGRSGPVRPPRTLPMAAWGLSLVRATLCFRLVACMCWGWEAGQGLVESARIQKVLKLKMLRDHLDFFSV